MSRARTRVFAALVAIGMLTLGGPATISAAAPDDGIGAALLVAEEAPEGLLPLGIEDATEFDIDFPSYDANGGLDKANQKWSRNTLEGTERVAAMIDFRMLFPDDAAAQAYLDEAEEILSEKLDGPDAAGGHPRGGRRDAPLCRHRGGERVVRAGPELPVPGGPGRGQAVPPRLWHDPRGRATRRPGRRRPDRRVAGHPAPGLARPERRAVQSARRARNHRLSCPARSLPRAVDPSFSPAPAGAQLRQWAVGRHRQQRVLVH